MATWMIVVTVLVLMGIVAFLLPGKAIKDGRNVPPGQMASEFQSLIDSQRAENQRGQRHR